MIPKLFEAVKHCPHPDEPEKGVRTWGLTFLADNEQEARTICRIWGLQYDGECVAILDETPDGFRTAYDNGEPL